jgi:hypothetical protein
MKKQGGLIRALVGRPTFPDVAHYVILRRCSASVAFGPERTSDGRQVRLHQSRMTPSGHRAQRSAAIRNIPNRSAMTWRGRPSRAGSSAVPALKARPSARRLQSLRRSRSGDLRAPRFATRSRAPWRRGPGQRRISARVDPRHSESGCNLARRQRLTRLPSGR